MAATATRPLNNRLGLIYMALGMFAYSAVDTQAKFLTETLHPFQVVWCRQLGLLSGVVILLMIKGFVIFRTKHLKLQLTRGGLAACSASLFIMALAYVPLADAVAVSFVAPFMVTVIAAVVLREPVGIRRWAAVTLGFVGMLIVVRPGTGVMHPAVLLVALAALFFALRQIVSRVLSSSDSTETTVAYTAIGSLVLLSLPLPFIWQWPTSTTQIVVLISMALMAALGEILVIKALEVAHAVVVAPTQYTLIVWGTFYGFMVFGQLPDFWTWVGAAVIIGSGIYTLQRERRVKG